jgi:hypothetical protein
LLVNTSIIYWQIYNLFQIYGQSLMIAQRIFSKK